MAYFASKLSVRVKYTSLCVCVSARARAFVHILDAILMINNWDKENLNFSIVSNYEGSFDTTNNVSIVNITER